MKNKERELILITINMKQLLKTVLQEEAKQAALDKLDDETPYHCRLGNEIPLSQI